MTSELSLLFTRLLPTRTEEIAQAVTPLCIQKMLLSNLNKDADNLEVYRSFAEYLQAVPRSMS